MRTGLIAACCIAACAVDAAFAAPTTIDKGVVRKSQLAVVQTVLGDYEGQWKSQLTDNVYDDISRYKLDRPVLRLALDKDQRLTVTFYMDKAAAAANDPLDLLGFGCHSRVGNLLALDVHKAPKVPPGEPRPVFDATFDFDWGNCPSRVYAVASNDLKMKVSANDTDREYVMSLLLLKNVQSDNKVYITQDGVKREVKLRPKPGATSTSDAELQYCVVNALGEVEACFDRESELKRFLVPFPFPGMSAAWYTKKSPTFDIKPGKKFTYHEAVFRKAFDE